MTDTAPTTEHIGPPDAASTARRDRQMRIVLSWAMLLGAGLTVTGIALGIAKAAHRSVIECSDGHYFPQGTTDFRCFSHPDAGTGAAIAVTAAMIGLVIGLLGVIAFKVVVPRRESDG